jgi:hypothetical protein
VPDEKYIHDYLVDLLTLAKKDPRKAREGFKKVLKPFFTVPEGQGAARRYKLVVAIDPEKLSGATHHRPTRTRPERRLSNKKPRFR